MDDETEMTSAKNRTAPAVWSTNGIHSNRNNNYNHHHQVNTDSTSLVINDKLYCPELPSHLTNSLPEMKQLLEEYLRVINDKDTTIHHYIKNEQALQAASTYTEDMLKRKIAKLHRQLQVKKQELEHCTKSLTEMERQITCLTEAQQSATSAAEVAEREAKTQKAQLEDEIHGLTTNYTSAIQANNEIQKKFDALEKEKNNVVNALESMTSKYVSVEESNKEKSKEIEVLREESKCQQREMCKLQEALNNCVPREVAQEQVRDLEKKINEMNEINKAIQAESTSVQQALHVLENKYNQVIRLNSHQEEVINELKQELAVMQVKCTSATSHSEQLLTHAEDKYKALYNEHQSTLNTLAECQKELDKKLHALHELSVELTKVQVESRERAELNGNEKKQLQLNCTRAEELVERLQGKNKALETQQNEYMTQIHAIKEEHSKQIASVNEKLLIATEHERHLIEELRRNKDSCTQIEHELRSNSHTHELRVSELNKRKDELLQQLQMSKEQQSYVESEMKRMQIKQEQEILQMQHAYKQTLEQTNKLHENAIIELNAQIDRMKKELMEHSGGNKHVQREMKHIAEVQQELSTDLIKARQEITSKEAEIKSLHSAQERLQSQVTKYRAENEQLETQYAEIHHKCTIAHRMATEVKETQEQTERRLERVQRELQNAEDRNVALQATLEQKENMILRAKEENSTHIAAIRVEQAKISELQQQKVKLHGQLEELEKMNGILRNSTLRDKDNEIARLQQEIRSLQDQIEEHEQTESRTQREMDRVTQHAQEVERLAQETSELLRRTRIEHEAELIQMKNNQKEALVLLPEAQAKNELLKEKIENLTEVYETKMHGAQDKINALQHEIGTNHESIAKLERKLEVQLAELRKVESQNKAMSEAIAINEKTYSAKRAELHNMHEQLARSEKEWAVKEENMKEEVKAAQEVRVQCKREHDKMMTLLEEKERHMKRAMEAEQAGRTREQKLTARVEEVEHALLMQTHEHEMKMREWENEVKAANTERVRQVEAIRRSLNNEQEDKANLQNELQELQMQYNNTKSELNILQEKYLTCFMQCVEMLDSNVMQFKADVMNSWLDDRAELITNCINVFKQMMHNMEASKTKIHEEHERTKFKWDAERHKINENHEAEINKLRRQCTERMSNADKSHDLEISSWKDKYEKLENLQHAMKQQHTTEMKECEERHAKLSVDLTNVQEQLERAKREVDVLQIKSVSNDERLAQANSVMESMHSKHLTEVQTLQRKINELQSEVQNNEGELRELRKNYTTVQRESHDAHSELDKLKRQLMQHDDRSNRLHVNYDERRIEIGRLQQQVVQLQKVISSNTELQSNLQKEHEVELQKVKEQLSEAQSTIHTLHVERRRLQHQLEDLHLAHENYTREIALLHRSENDLNDALQAARADASTAREKCANTESLRVIAENTLAETQLREKELLLKVDELRSSLHVLQICFDTQQAQMQEEAIEEQSISIM